MMSPEASVGEGGEGGEGAGERDTRFKDQTSRVEANFFIFMQADDSDDKTVLHFRL